jgi:hypothetical protein
MHEHDLTRLLREWPYDPRRIDVRLVKGTDGREKLQLRVLLGVLQLETAGRPDGQRPQGFESLLEYHRDRLARYVNQTGGEAGFVLSTAECAELREEALQYYHRYVGLFALRSYRAVIRDAQRNLEVFDLCRDYGETELDRTVLEQFRPQVIAQRARSEAEVALAEQRPKEALAALDRGLEELRAALSEPGQGGDFDRCNEVQLLRGMRDVLIPKLPASQKAELEERLRAALAAENYELAAILRDELKML